MTLRREICRTFRVLGNFFHVEVNIYIRFTTVERRIRAVKNGVVHAFNPVVAVAVAEGLPFEDYCCTMALVRWRRFRLCCSVYARACWYLNL